MWNSFEQAILKVTDKIAPLEEVRINIIRKVSVALKKQQNRRSYLLRKRKRLGQREDEKLELKTLNKSIRGHYYEERKKHIRRKIVPGKNKSLWDAVKIAKDIEPTHLPTKLMREGHCYGRKGAPMAFAGYFKSEKRA